MIINLLNKIPIKIYLYIIVFIIIASGLIAAYMYFNMGFDIVYKSVLIWYIIILELNLIHLFMVLKFYQSNLNKKGEKGDTGKVGPRGFKGEDDMCRSCDGEGKNINKMAGTTSDTVVPINNNRVVSGKCMFPFIHNYDYQYDCFKGKLPEDIYEQLSEDDKKDANASVYGWCATKLKPDKTPETIGFCNESKNAAIKSKLREKRARDRIAYQQNNKGIVDLMLVDGITKQDAAKNCPSGYTINPQDLNEGTGGRFIYMCYKEDTSGKGITDLRVAKQTCDANNIKDCPPNEMEGYDVVKNHNKENLHLNKDSKNAEEQSEKLYLYKKIEGTGFLKDIQFTKSDSLTNVKCLDGYENPGFDVKYKQLAQNLNEHSDKDDASGTGISHIINLCVKRTGDNLVSIDTAFVYKDNNLYFFRGNQFFKMKKKPIKNALLIEENYPKDVSEKWFKSDSGSKKKKAKMCSAYDNNENSCQMHSNCSYDKQFSKCEPKANYDAVFTYGYDSKTYFFKGDKVYLYDDTKMKLASGFPKKISDVFKGVPNDISAVFTWSYDGKTYFFKDKMYYKYNDKAKKVERGYPRKSNTRWPGIPNMINAIFSLSSKIDSKDASSTYIISDDRSFVIDEKTSSVKQKKKVSERFSGLSISESESE